MENCKAMESGAEKKAMSFGFSLGDERIKLIDILSEDDDFLFASPFCDSVGDSSSVAGRTEHFGEQGIFRLSGFGCSREVEKIQQREHNFLPADFVEQSRPSYLRRSLAWDSAFFNSAGVLDPDELSLINKGFGTDSHLLSATHSVRKRRPELDTMGDGDGSSLDWFEIEPFEKRRPSTYKSKPCKGFGMANMSLDLGSARNKVKSNQTDMRKSFSLHTEEKIKETNNRGGKRALSSPKPPSGNSWDNSTRPNRTDYPGKLNVKMENGSARIGSGFNGRSMVIEKHPASQGSPKAEISSTVSVPFYNTPLGLEASSSFSTTKRRKSKLYSSLSTSRIVKDSTQSKSVLNHPSQPFPSSLSNKQRSHVSNIDFNTKMNTKEVDASDLKRKSHSPLILSPENQDKRFPKQYSSSAAAKVCSSGSLNTFKPSELRPPSPKIGHFDEETPVSSQGAISKKRLENIESDSNLLGTKAQFRSLRVFPASSISSGRASFCNKLTSGITDTARKIKRSKTPRLSASLSKDKEKLAETEKVGDAKRSRNKVSLNSSMEEEKRKDVLKNKRCKGSPGPVEDVGNIKKRDDGNGSEDQIGNLSRYFEAIALDQDKMKQLQHKNKQTSTNHSSKPCPFYYVPSTRRTPLADKSCVCNLNASNMY